MAAQDNEFDYGSVSQNPGGNPSSQGAARDAAAGCSARPSGTHRSGLAWLIVFAGGLLIARRRQRLGIVPLGLAVLLAGCVGRSEGAAQSFAAVDAAADAQDIATPDAGNTDSADTPSEEDQMPLIDTHHTGGSKFAAQFGNDSSKWIYVSSGGKFACGVRASGITQCWGAVPSGKAKTPTDDKFVAVSAGNHVACGLRANGTTRCWGADNHMPQIPAEMTFSIISAAHARVCGIKVDGTVACFQPKGKPAFSPKGKFIALDRDWNRHCGVRVDGSIVCWDWDKELPDLPPSGNDFVSVAVKSATESSTVCGLRKSGTITCSDKGAPEKLSKESFKLVSGRSTSFCAIRQDDTLFCWPTEHHRGELPAASTKFVQVSLGFGHGCGLTPGGDIVCWTGKFVSMTLPGLPVDADGPLPSCSDLTVNEVAKALWPLRHGCDIATECKVVGSHKDGLFQVGNSCTRGIAVLAANKAKAEKILDHALQCGLKGKDILKAYTSCLADAPFSKIRCMDSKCTVDGSHR